MMSVFWPSVDSLIVTSSLCKISGEQGGPFGGAAGCRVFCCGKGSESGTQGKQGQLEVGVAGKEETCWRSAYTHEFIYEFLMPTSFEMTDLCAAIIFAVAYTPTEGSNAVDPKRVFWEQVAYLVNRIPRKERLCVLRNDNALT